MSFALIFDCDGVLVDSEPLSIAELGDTLRMAGADISDAEMFQRMIGRSVASITQMVQQEHGVDVSPLLPDYRRRLAERFRQELQPIPGIAAALTALQGMPMAVASSSTPGRIAQSLELTGLSGFFGGHVYSAVQVQNGKPAPDLFLLAARHLAVPPENCIVIEDSGAGIQAARAAGMYAIGLLGGSHAQASGLAHKLPQLGADAIATHADELPGIVQAHIGAALTG
ncbi:HAD family hydrolase [Paracoccus fistulariae]|uniref:HAD family phosphatase n=1 Tax=Paracoccus fistulariae TaxID=658446 RepID=A0ABY7SNV5_9RHOB|nr:HAD family phosphatase [Paracoccus fistulariae]MDB6182365.1 HAD family phosphatase [Paracoccus fistulariae]WCR08657.1 HAD family phosphatase [Paracoccus fistulariae]